MLSIVSFTKLGAFLVFENQANPSSPDLRIRLSVTVPRPLRSPILPKQTLPLSAQYRGRPQAFNSIIPPSPFPFGHKPALFIYLYFIYFQSLTVSAQYHLSIYFSLDSFHASISVEHYV